MLSCKWWLHQHCSQCDQLLCFAQKDPVNFEIKSPGNIGLMTLLEVTFFSPPSWKQLDTAIFLKGCFRTVTRCTGLSVAVLYQIGSDAEQRYPNPDWAGKGVNSSFRLLRNQNQLPNAWKVGCLNSGLHSNLFLCHWKPCYLLTRAVEREEGCWKPLKAPPRLVGLPWVLAGHRGEERSIPVLCRGQPPHLLLIFCFPLPQTWNISCSLVSAFCRCFKSNWWATSPLEGLLSLYPPPPERKASNLRGVCKCESS